MIFLISIQILSLLASLLALIQSLMTSFGRPYPIWCSPYKAEPDCPSPVSPPGNTACFSTYVFSTQA